MKAAFIRQTGTPDVIAYGELPTPEPGPTEVLVKVGAVSVNPIDTYIRSGMIKVATSFPYIVGCDLAGTIEQVGSQVTRFKAGDRVWGSNQSLFGRRGSFAEYAAVDETWLYPTSAAMNDSQAAAGALTGITAHLGLFLNAGLKPGEVVLVNGGTGGVGSAVIQLAKAAGAKVIATVGNAEKKTLCESWGTDCVLDYHSATLDDQIKAFASANGGLQVWYETQAPTNFDRTIGLMSPRGRIIVMAGRNARPEFPNGAFYVKDLRLFGFAMFNATPDEQRACAEAINSLATRGGWHPQIGRTLPLAETATAHRLQEENTLQKQGTLTGKIVLVP
ncbi:MAG: NADPH:quinone reductase [Planctomycetes bacterium]|nr:NADPH:quinone reductase [Planctomycetota bacterium]